MLTNEVLGSNKSSTFIVMQFEDGFYLHPLQHETMYGSPNIPIFEILSITFFNYDKYQHRAIAPYLTEIRHKCIFDRKLWSTICLKWEIIDVTEVKYHNMYTIQLCVQFNVFLLIWLQIWDGTKGCHITKILKKLCLGHFAFVVSWVASTIVTNLSFVLWILSHNKMWWRILWQKIKIIHRFKQIQNCLFYQFAGLLDTHKAWLLNIIFMDLAHFVFLSIDPPFDFDESKVMACLKQL